MRLCSCTISLLFVVAMLAGCASTKVTQATPIVSPELPRPHQIWIYDFIADPAQIPADSALRDELSHAERSAESRRARNWPPVWRLNR